MRTGFRSIICIHSTRRAGLRMSIWLPFHGTFAGNLWGGAAMCFGEGVA